MRSFNLPAHTEETIFSCNVGQRPFVFAQCPFVFAGAFEGTGLSRSTAGTLQRDCSSLSPSTMSGLKAQALDPSVPLRKSSHAASDIAPVSPARSQPFRGSLAGHFHSFMALTNLSISSIHLPRLHKSNVPNIKRPVLPNAYYSCTSYRY